MANYPEDQSQDVGGGLPLELALAQQRAGERNGLRFSPQQGSGLPLASGEQNNPILPRPDVNMDINAWSNNPAAVAAMNGNGPLSPDVIQLMAGQPGGYQPIQTSPLGGIDYGPGYEQPSPGSQPVPSWMNDQTYQGGPAVTTGTTGDLAGPQPSLPPAPSQAFMPSERPQAAESPAHAYLEAQLARMQYVAQNPLYRLGMGLQGKDPDAPVREFAGKLYEVDRQFAADQRASEAHAVTMAIDRDKLIDSETTIIKNAQQRLALMNEGPEKDAARAQLAREIQARHNGLMRINGMPYLNMSTDEANTLLNDGTGKLVDDLANSFKFASADTLARARQAAALESDPSKKRAAAMAVLDGDKKRFLADAQANMPTFVAHVVDAMKKQNGGKMPFAEEVDATLSKIMDTMTPEEARRTFGAPKELLSEVLGGWHESGTKKTSAYGALHLESSDAQGKAMKIDAKAADYLDQTKGGQRWMAQTGTTTMDPGAMARMARDLGPAAFSAIKNDAQALSDEHDRAQARLKAGDVEDARKKADLAIEREKKVFETPLATKYQGKSADHLYSAKIGPNGEVLNFRDSTDQAIGTLKKDELAQAIARENGDPAKLYHFNSDQAKALEDRLKAMSLKNTTRAIVASMGDRTPFMQAVEAYVAKGLGNPNLIDYYRTQYPLYLQQTRADISGGGGRMTQTEVTGEAATNPSLWIGKKQAQMMIDIADRNDENANRLAFHTRDLGTVRQEAQRIKDAAAVPANPGRGMTPAGRR